MMRRQSVSLISVFMLLFIILGRISLADERARQAEDETSDRALELPVWKAIGPKRVVGIDLSYATETDELLARVRVFTRLQSLTLDYSDVSDAGMAHLKNFKKLKRLSLSKTSVGDAGVDGRNLRGLV